MYGDKAWIMIKLSQNPGRKESQQDYSSSVVNKLDQGREHKKTIPLWKPRRKESQHDYSFSVVNKLDQGREHEKTILLWKPGRKEDYSGFYG